MLKTAIATLASLLAGSATAVTILTATLTNGSENPPTNPTTAAGAPRSSSGIAIFAINDAMTSMSFAAMVFGIDVTGSQSADPNDNLGNAHIHAGPGVTPTTNGPVVWGFVGMPFNNNNPNDGTMTPFASGVGGIFTGTWDMNEGNATTFLDQLANILAGRAYINFHTTQFPGGEIRGNIKLALSEVPSPAPEPETYMMLLGGFALFAFTAYRRGRHR